VATVPLDITGMLPAALTAPDLTEAEFLDLCQKFPDALLEYTPEGTILIMPPTDPETSAIVSEVGFQLRGWSKKVGGIVIGPDGGFYLPGGSRRSPDAAWFDQTRWQAAKRPGTRFPTFAPEFIIEVRSPNDRLRTVHSKMIEYIDAGVLLGWLIDPRNRTVAIYRPGSVPEVLENPATVAGEDPVAGFELVLDDIFPK
jgi:Uma2 family endonuclease